MIAQELDDLRIVPRGSRSGDGEQIAAESDGRFHTDMLGACRGGSGASLDQPMPTAYPSPRWVLAVHCSYAQKVKRGAVLGSCGNSGNSSEPHLHFQLQDGPLFEKSWGIEPIFQDVPVSRDGKSEVMKEYTWLKGDRVGKAK